MEERPLFEEAFDAPNFVGEKDEDPLEEEEISDDTYGLLYVGYLTDVVNIGTHEIRIRTLRIGEELNAALLSNKYKDTIEEARALATALVSASIVSVDNEPLITDGLGPHSDTQEARFDYLLNNWYWESIRQVWAGYNELLLRVQHSGEEIKKD